MNHRLVRNIRTLMEPPLVIVGVRTLCIVSLLALAPSAARADCAAAPLGNADDMVVSFLAANGVQASSSSLLPSSVKEGMLVYDDAADSLKLCDGTNWQPISMGTASDPRIGTLTVNKWCAVNAAGDTIDCDQNAPVATSAAGSGGEIQFNNGSNAFAADSNLFWDNTNKRLGIGAGTPEVPMQIGAALTGSLGFNNVPTQLRIYDEPAQTASATNPTTLDIYTRPAPAANSSSSFHGIMVNMAVPSTASVSYASLVGTRNYVAYQGAGNVTTLIGTTNAAAFGGTGAATSIYGGLGQASNTSTGTVTNAYGLYSTITNSNASGVITTAYGLYLTKINNGTITNNYGIYQNDTSNNYFGGSVGIGTTSPQSLLHVNGGIQMADDVASCPGASNIKIGTLRYNSDKIQFCKTTGWTDIAASGSAAAAGSNGQVQFNDGANAFAADSNLFWDNTNKRLGIGTATPQTILNIVKEGIGGNIQLENYGGVAAYPFVKGIKYGGTIAAPTAVATGNSLLGLYAHAYDGAGTAYAGGMDVKAEQGWTSSIHDSYLTFSTTSGTTSSEKMRITSAGNVGIGTTTPQFKLQVSETGQFGLGVNTASYNSLYLSMTYAGYGSSSNAWFWGIPGLGSVQIISGSGDVVFPGGVAGAGKVGIGTTPVAKLDVAGGARVGADATCTVAKAGMLAWNSNALQLCLSSGAWTSLSSSTGSAAAAGSTGQVQFNDGANALAADSNLFWDNTNKRLGIGTASPIAQLHIHTTQATGGIGGAIALTRYPTNYGAGIFSFYSSGDKLGFAVSDDNTTPIDISKAAMTVVPGQVGIGTTTPNPGTKLSVSASTNDNLPLGITGGLTLTGNWNGIGFGYGGSTYALKGGILFERVAGTAAVPGKMHFALDDTNDSSNVTVADAKMTITPDGNVGIGTTTPATALDVAGDITAQIISTDYPNATYDAWIQGSPVGSTGTARNLALLGNSSTDTLYLNYSSEYAGGTVIGGPVSTSGTMTASSFSGSGASLTSLNASNLASGTVATARLGSGTANSTTYLRGDGTWAAPPAGGATAAGLDTQVQFNDGGTALSGDAGLTYNKTTDALTVGGALTTAGTLTVASTGNANLYMQPAVDTGLTDFRMYNSDGTTADYWRFLGYGKSYASWQRKLRIMSYDTGTGTDIMTLMANGNIGIGKTAPSTLLDVNGTVTAATFSGSGASLTALNASNLASGTVPDGRITGAYSGITTLSATTGNFSNVTATGSLTGTLVHDNSYMDILPYAANGTYDDGDWARLYYHGVNDRLYLYRYNAGTAAITLDVNGTVDATTFVGSGASLTGLNGTNISSGTVAAARLGASPAAAKVLHGDNTWASVDTTDILNSTIVNADIDSTTNFTMNQLTLSSKLVNAVGTAALPAYTFTGDTNTGIYWVAADKLGFSTGGALQMLISASGICSDASGFSCASVPGIVAAGQNYSDARVKKDVVLLNSQQGLESVLKLKPVRFHWKDAARDAKEGEQFGFIAQDVEKVLPQAVSIGGDVVIRTTDGKDELVEGIKRLPYQNLVPSIVKALQDLKADNDNLRAEFEAYKAAHP